MTVRSCKDGQEGDKVWSVWSTTKECEAGTRWIKGGHEEWWKEIEAE